MGNLTLEQLEVRRKKINSWIEKEKAKARANRMELARLREVETSLRFEIEHRRLVESFDVSA